MRLSAPMQSDYNHPENASENENQFDNENASDAETSGSNYEEESQQSNGTTIERKNALQRYRIMMYAKQKEAILSAARSEVEDYARYAPFATSTQIVLFDDDSESSTTAQDLEILGI